MHWAPTPHTENMTPHNIYAAALRWCLGEEGGEERVGLSDIGLLLKDRYGFMIIIHAIRETRFRPREQKNISAAAPFEACICQTPIYSSLLHTHTLTAVRNIPRMRNSQILQSPSGHWSWDRRERPGLISAAVGGTPCRDSCASTCLGECGCVCVNVYGCV